MNQSMRIALRNTSRQKKRTFLLAGAVAFGFFIITLIQAFTAGVAISVQENISYLTGGHIYLSGGVINSRGSEISKIEDTEPVFESIEALDDDVKGLIRSIHQRSNSNGSLIFGSNVRGTRLEGVRLETEPQFLEQLTIIEGSLEDFANNPKGIILSADIARKLNLAIGESVLYRTQSVTGQENVGEFILTATITDQSLGFGFSAGFAHLEQVNELLGLRPNEFQTLSLYLNQVELIKPVADAIEAELTQRAPFLTIENEEDSEESMRRNMNRMFGFATSQKIDEEDRWEGTRFSISNITEIMSFFETLMAVINQIGFVIFLIVLFITMVGIINSYRMVLIERSAEIGTMRAIGVHKSGIRSIFIWEALFIALLGALIGILISGLAILIFSNIDFGAEGPMGIFLNDGKFIFEFSLLGSVFNIIVLAILSLLAVYIPARAAAKLKPADALRTTN